jgi:hypothetical protein
MNYDTSRFKLGQGDQARHRHRCQGPGRGVTISLELDPRLPAELIRRPQES